MNTKILMAAAGLVILGATGFIAATDVDNPLSLVFEGDNCFYHAVEIDGQTFESFEELEEHVGEEIDRSNFEIVEGIVTEPVCPEE